MKNFEKIAVLGSLLSKKYAVNLFGLLKDYKSISASEASSRLSLHVQTVQEFFDATTQIGITAKEEVFERKRPYFRYSLANPTVSMQFDLAELLEERIQGEAGNENSRIRERKNSNTHFTMARGGEHFSSVVVMSGSGRGSKQRKINLSSAQGTFLFHLPFPDAEPLSVKNIMEKANISEEYGPEIDGLINDLIDMQIIESVD